MGVQFETQPLIGGSVDWGAIFWYVIPSLAVGIAVVIGVLMARRMHQAGQSR